MAMLQAYGVLALLNSQNVLTGTFDLSSFDDPDPDRDADRRRGRPDVDRRADHRARHRQRHQLHHLRRHRQPRAGRAQRLPAQPEHHRWRSGSRVVAVAAVGVIIYIQEGQRRIPIQYASRVRGRRMYSGGQTFLPLRVNQAGVIPIIFAVSILLFPHQLATYFSTSNIPIVKPISDVIVDVLQQHARRSTSSCTSC